MVYCGCGGQFRIVLITVRGKKLPHHQCDWCRAKIRLVTK